jgi:hypothetical protein
MRKTLAVLVLIALSGVSAYASGEPSLVGIWYSAGQPDEPNVMSLIEFMADGTFREEFRKCEDGKTVGFQFQSGTWSVENGVEHTVTTMINGEASKVEDIYRIDLLTDTQRRIRMEPQGYVFSSLRVSEFTFPDCASGA